jgi:lysophospholipid acyltransferase (LPLAT)-like uncharacterized protein
MTGALVVPFGCAVDRAWRLKSWDHFEIPKPFSRACVVFGEPLQVPAKPDADAAAVLVAELDKRINQVEAEALAQLTTRKPA